MAMIMKKIGKIGVNMIYVTGGSRAQRKYAQSLAEFCLKKLLPRHKTIIVDINLCRVANGSVGNCLPTSDFNKPREFEIEVDCRMKLRDLLTTIAGISCLLSAITQNDNQAVHRNREKVKDRRA